jgi:hypothetical protein
MRRIRQNLAYTCKIAFGLVDDTCCDLLTLSNTVNDICTRGYPHKLFAHYSRVDARKLYSERISKLWNSLPAKLEHFLLSLLSIVLFLILILVVLPQLVFKVPVSAYWPWHFVIQRLNLLLLSVLVFFAAK